MSVIVERRGNRVSTRRHQSNLEVMLARPGGIHRDQAIAEANRRVEAMRDSSMDDLHGLIENLDGVFKDKQRAQNDTLSEIRGLSGQIITLSETFGLAYLAEAAKRLCDLVSALLEWRKHNPEVLEIHVRAVRMFSPRQEAVPAEAAKAILSELCRLLRHLGIEVAEDVPDTDRGPR